MGRYVWQKSWWLSWKLGSIFVKHSTLLTLRTSLMVMGDLLDGLLKLAVFVWCEYLNILSPRCSLFLVPGRRK